MTRTPRVTHAIRRRLTGLTDPYMTNRKLVYFGATLALAGAGAGTLTGLSGTATTAASTTAAASTTTGAASTAGRPSVALATMPASQQSPRATAHEPAPHAVAGQARQAPHARTWLAIERIAASHTTPRAGGGPLPAQDRLTPAGTSGPQSWLPMTQARYANAAAIVHQALGKKMGLRSAVIAVATAMQESTLLNLNHGDRDSLGLFQQRPSTGWGSPSQILRPAYAADAFLDALHTHQSQDPAWARQPLWQDAQDVQKSGFPYAYAKWEAQAAHIVSTVTRGIY